MDASDLSSIVEDITKCGEALRRVQEHPKVGAEAYSRKDRTRRCHCKELWKGTTKTGAIQKLKLTRSE